MTPQAFSYGTLGSNGMIYMPPYGLTESLDYMLKLNPDTYEISKIQLKVDSSREKWTIGTTIDNKIYFLPYDESSILIVNTDDDTVEYINLNVSGTGKYNSAHYYNGKIISLPYGVGCDYDLALILDINTHEFQLKRIDSMMDQKKWHTTQIIDNIIYGVPRGERWEKPFFSQRIEFNCDTTDYVLTDISDLWVDIDEQSYSNKKFTTMAKYKNKLFAPPYSENPNFDLMLKFDKGWTYEHTGLTKTSRKYYSHTVARNGKIYFPPAGHDEEWSDLLVINGETSKWYTKDLGVGKESKKYFAGCENSNNKLYYIPRGGCVCEPEHDWKKFGDLVEVLVIDTKDDSHYTVDISEYFTDNTTIEKYNHCLLVNDKIFAFPYGESDSFQTMLIFDTIAEEVIKVIDLNEV